MGRVLARHRLLVAEQQRLVAGVEVRALELRMTLQIEPAGLHEAQRLGDAVGELLVMVRLRRVLDEAERPLADIGEIGIAAVHEGPQQIEGSGGMAIGLDLPQRIGAAGFLGELHCVDDVAAIARQLLAVPLLGRRGARLGELAGDAADLHHRQRRRVGEHHRHLQKDAQKVANVVGAHVVGAGLREALGAVAALQQEPLSQGDPAERLLEVACLSRENQRRKGCKLLLDLPQRVRVGIFGNLKDRFPAPAFARPTLGHAQPPTLHRPPAGAKFPATGELIHKRRSASPETLRAAGARFGHGRRRGR